MAEPSRRDSLEATLIGGVGSTAGIPGEPRRTGFFGLLLGSKPEPLDGIAEVDRGDIKDGVDWSNYLEEPPMPETPANPERIERLGVCCSGGGIRAAAFCLGGLQALSSAECFEKAEYLSAVSGGGYIAVAHAALRGLTRQLAAPASTKEQIEELLREPAPWSLDAPETVILRNHTTYLAPDLRGRIWGGSVVVYGLFKRLLPFVALISLLGVFFGWTLGAASGLHFRGGQSPSLDLGVTGRFAIFGSGGAFVLATLLLMLRGMMERVGSSTATRHRRTVAIALTAAAVAGAVGLMTSTAGLHALQDNPSADASLKVGLATGAIGAAIYLFLLWLRPPISKVVGLHAIFETWTVRLVTLGILIGLVFCLLPLLFSQITDDWHRLLGIFGGDVSLLVVVQRMARASRTASSTRWRRFAILVASYIAGPVVVLVAFLLVAFAAAARGPQWSGFGTAMWAIASFAFLVVVSVFDDEVRAPLHMLYRERLASAFIRYRALVDRSVASAEPPWDVPVNFADLDLGGMPRLVVCASVNVADDVVPPGRFAGPFTFEQTRSGGPLTGYVPTADLQAAAGHGVLTLPGMMAIAAAAFSPLMGRTTRPGWRLLFALFDVRLGMWLPNPRWLNGVHTASGNQLRQLTGRVDAKLGRGPRFESGPPPTALRPGWSYALREALGLNSVRLPYVYVTDGGHWENLGLVELFRRGCTRIVCFDASEDGGHPLTALGQAIALARDELGVDVDINVKQLWPGSAKDPRDKRIASSMCAVGQIIYPGGRDGVLIVVKNHLPADAPLDVRTYAETNSKFPFDSTLDQFFDDQRFDAYRELGYHGGQLAGQKLKSLEGVLETSWH